MHIKFEENGAWKDLKNQNSCAKVRPPVGKKTKNLWRGTNKADKDGAGIGVPWYTNSNTSGYVCEIYPVNK